MRLRVPLEASLASFSAPEKMLKYYDPALNAKTTAIKFTMLTSFPEYLVLHMGKFAVDEDWTPKKQDVSVDVPDIIDISHMHSKYLPPGSELQRAAAYDSAAFKMKPSEVLACEEIVSRLVSMGFPHLHCQKAAINTLNQGVAEATECLISHQEDAGIDFPIYRAEQEAKSSASLPNADSSNVDTSIGFQKEVTLKALQGWDIKKATERIFSNANISSPVDMEATPSALTEKIFSIANTSGPADMQVTPSTLTEKIFSIANTSGPADMQATPSTSPTPNIKLSDEEGRYKLMGFVSHVGTSSVSGHYVAYIFKDGRWVLFDDDKVHVAIDPPRDTGYLHFFERLKS